MFLSAKSEIFFSNKIIYKSFFNFANYKCIII